jgi:hypothetical protein
LSSLMVTLMSSTNAITAGQTTALVVNSINAGISAGGTSTTIFSPGSGAAHATVSEGFLNAFGLANEPGGVGPASIMLRFTLAQAPPAGTTVTFPGGVSSSGTAAFSTAQSDGTVLGTPQSFTSASTSFSAYYKLTAANNPIVLESIDIPVSITASPGYLVGGTISWTVTLAPVGAGTYSPTAPIPRFSAMESGPFVLANIVAPVSVTLQTIPSGLSVIVDGTSYSAPRTFTWTYGSSHALNTSTPQSGGSGTQYVWGSWSDGGAISHMVAPTTSTTYTANFTTQYYLTTSAGTGGTVSPPSGWYNSGASVQVQATPNGGYNFTGWTGTGSGSYTGTTNPATVTMNGPIIESAAFSQAMTSVTIQASPAGRSFSVDGIPYAATQTFSWVIGSSHAITTTSPQDLAGTRYVFANWSDGGAISHTITAPAGAATYTANFTTQYLLTKTASPSSAGTVGASPSSPDGYYASGTSVQVSATANMEYIFSNWSGDLTGGANPQTVTMSAPKSVTANFSSNSGITISTNPTGLSFMVDGISYSSTQVFFWVPGSNHIIGTSSPQGSGAARSIFVNWSDGGAFSHSISAPSTTTSFVATFKTQFQLTATPLPSGAGTINANPSSTDGFYDAGTMIALTALPAAGYSFTGWGGALGGSSNPGVLSMSEPRTIVGNFAQSTGGVGVTFLNPSRAAAGGASFGLAVAGTGFIGGKSILCWNGVPQSSTLVISSTKMTVFIDAVYIAYPGTANITVANTGGSVSNTMQFIIDPPPSPTPAISSISPVMATAGGPDFEVEVYGSNFLPDTAVRWNGSDRSTTFLSSKQLRAVIRENDISVPGAGIVTAVSPGEVGSNTMPFALLGAAPIISAISPPAVAAAGSDFTLTVYGMNFIHGSVIQWNGSVLQTSFINNSTITASIPASSITSAGTVNIVVITPYLSRSSSRPLQIISFPPGTPTITSLSPDPILSGGPAFILTVRGSGFVPASKVQYNFQERVTRIISANELQADIQASDIAASGVFAVTVSNPLAFSEGASLNATSNTEPPIGLSIVDNPMPFIMRITPASVPAGSSGFTASIEGMGFKKDVSFVQWNNKKLPSRFVSETLVQADIAPSDIAAEGIINFVITNPPPRGGTSNSQAFTITPAKPGLLQLFYPRLLSSTNSSASNETGIAIANLSGKDAAITFHAYDQQGNLIAGPDITNPVSVALSAIEQRAITGSQVFGPGMTLRNSVGWMKLESSETKVAGFFLVFDNDLQTLDGADVSSTVMSSFVFPEIEGLGFNQLHIANPGASAATVSFELCDWGGNAKAKVTRTINANGALAEYITNLFPGLTGQATDYIRVSSNQGLVPFSYMGVKGHDAKGLNGQDATKGATTLYSPQYVVGGADWSTTLSIVNLEAAQATVTLRFIGDDGTQIGATATRTIAGKGKLYVGAQDFFLSAGEMTQGYIEVKSNGARLAGSVVFGDPQQNKYAAALPLVSTLQTAMVFGQVASGMVGDKPYYTGLALLNPSNAAAQVLIELFDRDGRRVQSSSVTIPAGRRKSSLLTEYFPGLTGQNIGAGYIKVTSDRGLASFALFGSTIALSAVPAQAVP